MATRNRYRYVLGGAEVLTKPISTLRLISSQALHQTPQITAIRILIPNDLTLNKAPGEIYSTTQDTRLINELSPILAIKINNHWKPQSSPGLDATTTFETIQTRMRNDGYKFDPKIGYYKPQAFKFTNIETGKTFIKTGNDIKTVVDNFSKECENNKLTCQIQKKSSRLNLITCVRYGEPVSNYRVNKIDNKKQNQPCLPFGRTANLTQLSRCA